MTSANIIKLPGVSALPEKTPKTIRSTMDTVVVTRDGIANWKLPPFQRPLRVNAKLLAIAQELRHNGGVIPGILTVGVLAKEKYLIDGQHRVEAFKLSELEEGYADIRICYFDSMADMGDEFVSLNSSIVKLRPDDILRGLEGSIAALGDVRKACPFVGYDNIRRGGAAPLLSMALALRAWFLSQTEVPNSGAAGSARALAERLDTEEARRLAHFLSCCFEAWGGDKEYYRVYGALNLTLTAWLWRRTVIMPSGRVTRLTPQQFVSCLRALTASSGYMDWLVGRNHNERDRAPCYGRIKAIFAKRLETDNPGKRIFLPEPAWAASSYAKKLGLAL